MNNLTQIIIAAVAFGLAAFFATRLRLGFSAKGEARHVSEREYYRMKTEAGSKLLNRQLGRMGIVWLLVCAPVLAYQPGGGFDFKIFGVALLGCLLLGIILSIVAHTQMDAFKPIDIDLEWIDRRAGDHLLFLVNLGRYTPQEIEEEYLKYKQTAIEEAQNEARRKAQEPLSRGNYVIAVFVIVAVLLVPLLLPLGIWASALTLVWFLVFVIAIALLDIFLYAMAFSIMTI